MTEEKSSLVRKVADWYFRPKSFEKWENGRVYELIGMKKFKKICEYIGRKGRNDDGRENNYFIWDNSTDGLKKFEKKTRLNESVHFIGAVVPAICLTPGWIEGRPLAIYAGGILTAINAYSLLLQRYHRVRINRILERAAEK